MTKPPPKHLKRAAASSKFTLSKRLGRRKIISEVINLAKQILPTADEKNQKIVLYQYLFESYKASGQSNRGEQGSDRSAKITTAKMKYKFFILAIIALCFSACVDSPNQNANNQTSKTTNLKFTDATKTSGVNFQHVPTRTENKWLPEIMGSGVAIADFNRDGAPDIILVNSGAIGSETAT